MPLNQVILLEISILAKIENQAACLWKLSIPYLFRIMRKPFAAFTLQLKTLGGVWSHKRPIAFKTGLWKSGFQKDIFYIIIEPTMLETRVEI